MALRVLDPAIRITKARTWLSLPCHLFSLRRKKQTKGEDGISLRSSN